jgi:hypothetical protein
LMTSNLRLLFVSTASLFACSTIVGADFDVHEGERGGTSATSGGAAPQGGVASGGVPSTGGVKPTGGALSGGTNSSGGTAGTAAGGTSGGSGGTAGQPATGGTSASGASTGGSQVGTGGLGAGGSGAEAGEGGDGGVGGGAGAGGDAPGGSGGNPEAGAGGEAGSGGGPIGTPVVVLNEVKGQGSGDDYIEIFNRGPGTLNLEGYGLSDESNTFFFPAGSSITQGGHVLLLLGQPQPAPNATFMCFTPNPCYHATWGISQNGETVYLRGLQNQVLDSTGYPSQSGGSAITNDQTWGRLPDGQGTFRATRPTPEAVNQAP